MSTIIAPAVRLTTPEKAEVPFRCPECREGALDLRDGSLHCQNCSATFPHSAGRPVLFRADNGLFSPADYPDLPPQPRERSPLVRLVPDLALNLSSERVLGQLRTLLDERGSAKILVAGAGTQRMWLDGMLSSNGSHRLVYADIDVRSDVDLFADIHDLPFGDDTFDAVVTTAVLEHVLYPERAAAEIARVVKPGGYLYSEMPFIQQVHEGAYDFTRYTYSGHRRLFNRFKVLEGGMVAGPASALAWSIENFALAFVRASRGRAAVKAAVRTLFFWLKYLDYLLRNRPEAMDGACCTFLLGQKEGLATDADIVQGYIGAKHLTHV